MKLVTSTRNTLLPAVILLVSISAAAQTKELFKEVDKGKVEKVSAYNHTFLSKQIYFAKQHRIVEVDTDLLFGDDEFSMRLADDITIRVKRTKLVEFPQRKSAMWHGIVVSPGVSLAEMEVTEEKLAESGHTKAQLHQLVFGFLLHMNQWDVEQRSGKAILSSQRKYGVTSPEPIFEMPDMVPVHEGAFRSVSGEITVFVPGGARYRLAPLRFTPKYHLVLEVDPLKAYSYPEANDFSTHAEEAREKVRAYQSYLKSLPSVEGKVVMDEPVAGSSSNASTTAVSPSTGTGEVQ